MFTFEFTMLLDVCGDMPLGFMSAIYLFLLRLHSKVNKAL